MLDEYIDPPGMARIEQQDTLTHGPQTFIAVMRFPPSARGEGRGTKLLRRIIEDARAEGIELWIEPLSDDNRTTTKRLIRWYESMGFRHREGPFWSLDIC